METFSASLALCVGNSPVTGEFPAQRPVTRSFDDYLVCDWINRWGNNREAGDLRRHRAHYDVIVVKFVDIFVFSMITHRHVIGSLSLPPEEEVPTYITVPIVIAADALVTQWASSGMVLTVYIWHCSPELDKAGQYFTHSFIGELTELDRHMVEIVPQRSKEPRILL